MSRSSSIHLDEEPAVRVLAVDDQPVFRRTVRTLLEAAPGFVQVGEAASGAEAIELAARLRPDLVLLDVRMPGMDGVETARRLERAQTCGLLILTSVGDLSETAARRRPARALYLRKQELSARKLTDLWTEHARVDRLGP